MRTALDPALVAQENTHKEMIRRKLDMDALRKRLAPAKDKATELRGACEGFEAVFLQKMWEEMRKTVPKEGFLHSKDEEAYRSLFDVELCKKMASAGGIGLADMLYEQLSQQLADTGRTTTPGRIRNPLDVPPSNGLLAAPKTDADPASAPDASGRLTLRAEDLYSPLPDGADNGNGGDEDLDAALQNLRTEVENSSVSGPDGETGRVAGAHVAGNRRIEAAIAAGGAPAPAPGADAGMPPWNGAPEPTVGMPPRNNAPFTEAARHRLRPDGGVPPSGPAPTPPEAAYDKETAAGTAVLSWQGPGPVSAKPRPINNFARNRTHSRTGKKNDARVAPPAQEQLRTQTRAPAVPSLAPNADFPHNTGAAQAQSSTPARSSAQTRSPAQAHNQNADRMHEADGTFTPPPTRAPAGILDEALKPLPGPIVGRFGWEDDGTGRRRWKAGVEIAAAPGEPVRAVLPGTVVYAGPRDGAGNTVVIEHNEGYRSYYGNLQPTAVRVGERVARGAEFAKVAVQPAAQAGGENSASLHFELKKGEMALNPESVFNRADEARQQDARAG
jgi:murein DD-endopeptidase MepM/ murein hydrolase activator NlpD